MSTDDIRHGYKIYTHDWRSPLQEGPPICSTSPQFPLVLPVVQLDTSEAACGQSGYHYCADLTTAAKIAGYWPTGRPAHCLQVVAAPDVVERGNKRRASSLTLMGELDHAEIRDSMRRLVAPFAGIHADTVANSQLAWYVALGRPLRDPVAVQQGLRTALDVRGLPWSVKEFQDVMSLYNARAAWDAWDARAAWEAWEAWDAWDVWEAWDARVARDAEDARAAGDVWDAWAAGDARVAWDVWEAWEARDMRAAPASSALVLEITVLCFDFRSYPADYLTRGLREAYQHGLELAVPVNSSELGWVMCHD